MKAWEWLVWAVMAAGFVAAVVGFATGSLTL